MEAQRHHHLSFLFEVISLTISYATVCSLFLVFNKGFFEFLSFSCLKSISFNEIYYQIEQTFEHGKQNFVFVYPVLLVASYEYLRFGPLSIRKILMMLNLIETNSVFNSYPWVSAP